MHIGQFSLVICSFVLAVTAYFLLPDERLVFISLIALASAAPAFLASYFIKQERLQKYLIRAALVMLVAFIGFAWAQCKRPVLHMFGRDLIVARMDDELLVLRRRGHQYELDRLARHHGVAVREISCRPHCRLTLTGGIEFAYHDRLSGLTQSCRTADVIVMPFDEARYPCRAQLLDSPAFAKRVHRQFTSDGGQLHRQRLSRSRLWQQD